MSLRERTRAASRRSIDELEACFVVKDDGQKLAFVYFEDEPGRRMGGQDAHQR
jgi:hypothetical protein